VRRKERAALAWVEQINTLEPHQRMDCAWHYVLLGEEFVKNWESKGMRASEALEMARLRRPDEPGQGTIF
jgi:hypothetical protein